MSEVVSLFPTWKQAVLDFLAEKFEPGTVVPHEWFTEHFKLQEPQSIAEFQKYQFALLQNMDELRSCLLEDHSIALRTKIGVGYEVLPPQEQTAYALDAGMRRVRRELKWMASHLVNVDHGKLTADQRKENADGMARAAMLKSMFRKTQRMPLAAPAKRLTKKV